MAICFGSVGQLRTWMPELDSVTVLEALLPGPVTICVQRPSWLPDHVNPGVDTVGIRVPASALVATLAAKEPLCLTSANASGESSAITANDFAKLHPLLDAVVDTGPITDSNQSRLAKNGPIFR